MDLLNAFSRANADYIDQLYRQYQQDPTSVDERWAVFFAGFEAGGGAPGSVLEALLPSASGAPAEGINHLVHSYREFGHMEANLNPLADNRPKHPLLRLSEFGFSEESDLGRQVVAGGFQGPFDGTLGGLVQSLRTTYCGSLGVEYLDIADKTQREWLQAKMEPTLNRPELSAEQKKRILDLLIRAEGFEQYLHTKYVGQKRFSIQGAESSIPLLDTLLEIGGKLGADEIWMGMAHRGRLNVLAHVLGKPYANILREFEGTALPPEGGGDGDVKYHLGYSREREVGDNRVLKVTMSPNPSHLELVDPVVEGMVCARQAALGDSWHARVVPILIHGEAAFTGQGIVPETLSLSELENYRTGGTIHIIVNNQVGFTANPRETRFTPYPTDVARMIQAPIFHVNADDPEAVVHAARLAMEFRQEFKIDVMIDLWSYRKYGHNETDDPTFTQPVMYKKIEKMVSVRDQYQAKLLEEGVITPEEVDVMKGSLKAELDTAWGIARDPKTADRQSPFHGLWKDMTRPSGNWECDTRIPAKLIQAMSESLTTVPETFNLHPKLRKLVEARQEMASGTRPVDWGCAESWAFGSLLLEGTPVRLTGQDCARGTFSHRHAVFYDHESGEPYTPLRHLGPDQADITIVNTMLSEEAVLGFEYGYSTADPRNLVVWEAQFGDFVNGAQAIIDQFLSSAESKWERMTGLTLLLPHGYEGQGPEHSSARPERFLQLCADENMQVAYPSLPSQYFHLLRRQMHRNFRKPLVLMMPKSLLRDERYSSKLDEFFDGGFQLVIDDSTITAPDKVDRVLLCTGKVYYALAAQRETGPNTAIVRVEQLYPFPGKELEAVAKRYPNASDYLWVQEEPQNMGPWSFIEPRLREILPKAPRYCGRAEAASPAHGHYKVHQQEEAAFVREAFERSHRMRA